MKTYILDDDSRDEKLRLWTALEEAIHNAANMACLLASAVEERYGQTEEMAREQQEAICFGVYQLQDQVRETKELYAELWEAVRTVKIEREEIVPLEDGDTALKKVVSLH